MEVYIKPNSKRFQIKLEGDEVVIWCREAPEKGKVNRELVKELSKLFDRNVELVSGFTSRHKRILISSIEAAEIKRILASVSTSDTS